MDQKPEGRLFFNLVKSKPLIITAIETVNGFVNAC